jgi:segregation and condensation protein B
MPPPAKDAIVLGCGDAYTEPVSDLSNGLAPHGGETAGAEELKPILEALLFVSHEPVSLERLISALGMVSKTDVRQALVELQLEYEKSERGIRVSEIAGGFQFTTRPEYGPWIKSLGKSKPAPKLSRSGLESLAIIAYRQPIVRAEIEAIRGVETSGVLRTLLERKLVRIVGRKDVPGRPIMYGTTKYFLQHFGLNDLAELPPLREFKELGESEQVGLPVGDIPMDVQIEDAHSRSGGDAPSLASFSAAAADQ